MINKDSLLAKYPDSAFKINAVWDSIDKDKCSPCVINSRIIALRKELGDLTEEELKRYSTSSGRFSTSEGAPRPPCEECYKEHVAKAIINLTESVIGSAYPKHRWLAIGNLAEASAEIYGINPELAKEIREVKLQMIRDVKYVPDLMQYL